MKFHPYLTNIPVLKFTVYLSSYSCRNYTNQNGEIQVSETLVLEVQWFDLNNMILVTNIYWKYSILLILFRQKHGVQMAWKTLVCAPADC